MSERRKILMLTTQLGYGGAETSFIRLANFLSQSMEVRVAIFCHEGSYSAGHEPLSASIRVLDEGAKANQVIRWWRRVWRLRALKCEHDACISFLSGPNLVNVLAGYNARSVVSVRGSRVYDPLLSPRNRWLFHYLLDPVTYLCAARIIAVSDGLRHEISSIVGKGVWKKLRIISPFMNACEIAKRIAEPASAPYNALAGQPVIIAVGRLSVEKGFSHLIRVFSCVARHIQGAKLVLVGDGPGLTKLRSECESCGFVMDDVSSGVTSVIFAGYQKNVLPFMKLARVYAMTSATEGFPNVLLEAMAAGLTILASDTPWGARAVLRQTPDESTEPYPTVQPTKVESGTLMPRIDDPANDAIWAAELVKALQSPPPDGKDLQYRVQQFSPQLVGAQWLAMLKDIWQNEKPQ